MTGIENKTVYEEILKKIQQISSDKFAAIAAEQFNKLLEDINNNFSGQMCPDQYVGAIADFKDKKGEITEKFPERVNIFADETDNIGNIPNAENILILILESPHKDEFDKNGEPIGPANGSTGENIRNYITDIFGDAYEDYHLILINAIPFQCSLGVGTEHFRDAVFKTAWNDKAIGANFFKDRLKKLIKNLRNKAQKMFIVNACTDMNKFKKNIQKAIKEITKKDELQLEHPVRWRTNKNALKEKVDAAGLYKEKSHKK